MRVTGSKDKNRNSTRLSIRIPSGQSLHCGSCSVGSEVTAIDLWVEGAVAVPYPKALAERVDTEAIITASGVALGEGDRVVVAEAEGDIDYALRLSAESVVMVEEWQQRGLEVRFHSPLMSSVTRAIAGSRRKKTVVLTLLEGIAYAAYTYKKQLHYAEVLPIEGEEELVSLLAHLNQDFDLHGARFILLGESSKGYYKTLRKYFRRVSREN